MTTDGEYASLDTRASPDKMEVKLSGNLPFEVARAFDIDSLEKLLEDRGYSARPDPDKALRVCRQLRSGRTISAQVVAVGTRPVDGEDGRLELHFSNGVDVGAEEDDTGRMDYRERSLVKTVKAGELLLRVVPPSKGTPGVDVYGAAVQAKEGVEKLIQAGENVRMEGRNLYAEGDGAVVLRGGAISVVDELVVDSDVDYETGNVEMPCGSVEIRGTVRSGFLVMSQKNIAVRDVVEDAVLSAGGDIEVRGGVAAKDAGLIKAGGDFTSRYVHNARVQVEGDVHLTDGAIQSEIVAGGKIAVVQGKGKVSGGSLRAGGDIEINEAGAATGVATRVEIAPKCEEDARLDEKIALLEREHESLKRRLGERTDEEVLAQASAAELDELQALLAKRRIVSKRLTKFEGMRDEGYQRRLREFLKKRVVVKRRIHAGVVIAIAGRQARVTESRGPCHFFLDTHTDRVICGDGEPSD